MKILITGSNGQLGQELLHGVWKREKSLEGAGLKLIGLSRSELDISSATQTENAVSKFGPSLVINAAAYTAVDQAETERKAAFAVNRDGPANLARSCARAKIPLIHISTDFVFDGNRKSPYPETAPISPLGAYGESKAAGEEAVRAELTEHIILRTSWLYGAYGGNFVKTMLRLGKERDILRIVSDQYGCPTSSTDLAEATLLIAKHIRNSGKARWGTYHFCGRGITSWHGFAEKIFEFARKYGENRIPRVQPIPTAEYPTPAIRPAFSAMDCGQIQKHFGIKNRAWEKSLENVICRIYSGEMAMKESGFLLRPRLSCHFFCLRRFR